VVEASISGLSEYTNPIFHIIMRKKDLENGKNYFDIFSLNAA
jgi:hypothetical protein